MFFDRHKKSLQHISSIFPRSSGREAYAYCNGTVWFLQSDSSFSIVLTKLLTLQGYNIVVSSQSLSNVEIIICCVSVVGQ